MSNTNPTKTQGLNSSAPEGKAVGEQTTRFCFEKENKQKKKKRKKNRKKKQHKTKQTRKQIKTKQTPMNIANMSFP